MRRGSFYRLPKVNRALSVALLVTAITADTAKAEFDVFASAAGYCSKYPNQIKLNEDHTVLCFDGAIRPGRDFRPFFDLKPKSLFAIRSGGGFAPLAIQLANLLRDKDATVVIYDYCLSACANYFLIASSETYVVGKAIVAWHGGPSKHHFPCTAEVLKRLELHYLERYKTPLDTPPQMSGKWICDAPELSKEFFRQRRVAEQHIHRPQTAHTRKYYDLSWRQRPYMKDVFWMWHPQNHGEYFGSRIKYESYPSSQAEVDDLQQRLKLSVTLLYDPSRL